MSTTYDTAVEQVAQSVFATMVNVDLFRLQPDESPPPTELLATVSIAGAWTGKVVLAFSGQLARGSAATMLQMSPDQVTPADDQDVASELVNMIGGNLKSMLPGPSFLSLPTIISGSEIGLHMHDAELLEDVWMASECGTVRISLYAKPQTVT